MRWLLYWEGIHTSFHARMIIIIIILKKHLEANYPHYCGAVKSIEKKKDGGAAVLKFDFSPNSPRNIRSSKTVAGFVVEEILQVSTHYAVM